MQKFTAFSILVSLSVVLLMTDALWNKIPTGNEQVPAAIDVESIPETVQELPEVLPEEENPEETPVENPASTEDMEVDLSESLDSQLESGLFVRAGFSKAVLKDSLFSGLVFQFISFSDQSYATIYQWNLFDDEAFVGSISEIRYPTETGSFQGYLALRERASALTQLGTVNEVNNYGDASFYFNHKTKTKTVHLIMRKGRDIYAFEYAADHHEKMKNMFDILVSNL